MFVDNLGGHTSTGKHIQLTHSSQNPSKSNVTHDPFIKFLHSVISSTFNLLSIKLVVFQHTDHSLYQGLRRAPSMYCAPPPGYIISLSGNEQLDPSTTVMSRSPWASFQLPAQMLPSPELPSLGRSSRGSSHQEPPILGVSPRGGSPFEFSPQGPSSFRPPHHGTPFQGSLPQASPPRGMPSRGSPPGGLPPRWYPPSPNIGLPRPPFESGWRSTLRDRPVTVILERGGVYLCNRADILQQLPNTRQHPFGRTLYPNIGPDNETDSALDALHYIFRGLEMYRMTGTSMYLFERAQAFLYRDNEACYQSAFDFFLGVCAALDSEHGLGCSDELLQQIDEFAMDLMDAHELDFFNRAEHLMVFFISYSKVFQPTTPRHLDTLRALYNSVPVFHRARLMEGISRALQNNPRRSNVHTMFRAMRDMGMA
ncbi:hypothetical protein F5X99DRAFT_395362 [Biscogniauxia marginata]|nr:hypothetical protein F5X99DRAFT_395362 [Biscogniauxia marginata]